jgi:hypothetical protein
LTLTDKEWLAIVMAFWKSHIGSRAVACWTRGLLLYTNRPLRLWVSEVDLLYLHQQVPCKVKSLESRRSYLCHIHVIPSLFVSAQSAPPLPNPKWWFKNHNNTPMGLSLKKKATIYQIKHIFTVSRRVHHLLNHLCKVHAFL